MPNFSLDASFVYKSDDNIVGVTDTRSTFVPATFVDPFDSSTLTVFNRTSSAASALNTTDNQASWEQTYKSFIIQGYKRLTNRWSLHVLSMAGRRGHAGGAELHHHAESEHADQRIGPHQHRRHTRRQGLSDPRAAVAHQAGHPRVV